MIVHNRIQQFINTKFYYENISRRSLVAKKNSINALKVKKDDPKKKVLQFKVDGYRKKLVLLRQHKIKKDTYLRMFVTQKLSNVFPTSIQVYNSMVGILHYIFVKTPVRVGAVIAQNLLVQKIVYVMSRSFSFIYRLMFNLLYFIRLLGLKVKFLWDTLNHYLLI